MIHKILGRLSSVRSFVFAALALAISTMSASAAITVDPAKLTLRDGTFGEYYSGYMYFNGLDSYCTFSGGTAPYYITEKSGTTKTLPAGISINGSGGDYISFFGKAAAPGTYEVEVTITDSSEPAESVDATYTFTIKKAPLAVDSAQLVLKSGTVNEYYSAEITDSISGGAKPYAVTVDTPAQLPPGVTLNGSGTSYIYFSGTPTTAGPYNVDVTVTDQDSTQVQATYTITINEPPQSVPTPYVGPGGVPSNHDCVELNTSMTTLQSGWYVASGTLNFGTGGIVIDGDVKLVLADGATLTVQGAYNKAGIKVTGINSLTIYAQTEGTGVLNATGGDYSAGIGGDDDDGNCGTVTIYGGNITAIGSSDGAGIGAGFYGWGGDVSVYGGTVTAECGGYDYSGIGSNGNGKHGTLTVGGNVVVKAGSWKPLADYTVCQHNANGTITLDVANDGDYPPPTRCYFYLVTNDEEPQALPTITYIDGTDGETVLTGLTPTEYTPGGSTVYLPNASAVIKAGYMFNGWYLTPELDQGGSQVYAIYSFDSYTSDLTLYAKFTVQTYSISYRDHDNNYYYPDLEPSSYTITNTPVALATPAPRDGYTFDGWCENSDRSDPPIMTLPLNTTGYKTFYAKWTENGSGGGGDEPGDGTVLVSFVDASGSPMQQVCTPVTAETTTLTNGGWYVVNDNVEIGNSESGVSIAVEGTVNLVLMDGKSLTVHGPGFKAAIGVPSGSSLTIYGQTGGTGAIYATASDFGSGIGGDYSAECTGTSGAITINGGHIEATGGNYGAGIGGSYGCAGATVTVNGGYVKATSGRINVPGIGGGGVGATSVKPGNGTLTVAADVVVKAGLVPSLYDEDIKDADPVTHQITIDDSWTNFLIEKPAPASGTISNIVYHEADGTIIENLTPATYEEGVGVSLDTAVPPSKAGYTFAYWYAYGSADVPVTAVPDSATGDQHFYAKWTGNTYNITYYVDGVLDTSLSPKTYEAGKTAMLPLSLSKPNYTFDYWCDNPELTGDSFYYIPTTSVGDVTVYARFKPQNFSITYHDGSQTLSLEPSSYNIESETIVLPTPVKTDYVFDGWYTNSVFEGSTVTTIPTGSTGVRKFYSKWHAAPPATASDVPYTAGGSAGTHDCKILSTRVTELVDDWYVLTDDIDYGTTGLTVSGDVKLILADGATLTVEGDYAKAGIYVPVGSSLTIYAQSEGTGAILAAGGDWAAGIGGNQGPMGEDVADESNCGTVTIYGGIIEATGGTSGAGIGGGGEGAGGTVTIYGGVIEATGLGGASGVGGGNYGNGGSVTVNGGTVVANGSASAYSSEYHAAGIGGGVFASSQGTLSIAADITVKSGDADDALSVLASAAGSVTLDGKQYYAVIPLEQYNITYMDGASTLNLAPAKYTAGQVCPLPTPAKSGYTFAGWYTKADFSTVPVSEIPAEATGPQTVYSMWVEGNVGGVPEFTIDEQGKLTAANLKGNPEVTIPDVVTEIDRNVFKDVTTLRNVVILGNVKKVGNYAFQGCTGLESVTFGNGVEVIGDLSFDGCTALESVTFGNTIETIGEAAFQNTPSLTNPEDGLYFPDSVTSIGYDAFYNTGLAKASLPGGLYSEGSPLSSDFFNVNSETRAELVYRTDAVVFYISGGDLTAVDTKANTAITIPNTVTRIFPGVFEDCTLVETVTIPNSVTNIQMQAFKGCTGLTGVAIPDSVEYLDSYVFQGCTSLESATIGNGVESIPMNAFDGCTSLESVTIGSGVKSIGVGAFRNCSSLASVTIPDNVTSMVGSTFDGCTSLETVIIGNGLAAIPYAAFNDCTSLSSVTFGSSVASIGFGAFKGCCNLQAIDIPGTVTSIDGQAFAGSGLTGVTIPDSVTELGSSVFYDCDALASVTLGSGITSIGDGMFFGLTALESVTLRGNVTSIGENAFFNCTSLATFNFPSTVTSVGEDAFWKCGALEIEVRFPENSTIGRFAFFGSGITYAFIDKGGKVGALAFAECKNLARAIIADKEPTSGSKLLFAAKGRRLLGAASEDATEIADHAFFGCSDLESVALGKSVDSVGQGAFSGCPKLATFNVDPENDNYKTENGMLLTKDGATLISAFGEETSVTVPDGVVTVSGGAFAGYATLQSVVLPSGVTTIGEAAFSNATVFATITIPSTVTSIGANAFMDTVLATVNVEKDDAARVKTLVEATGYTGAVSYVEPGEDPGDEPTEWPEDPSTVEGKTAAEAFGITGELAEAKADDLATWAKANSVDFSNKNSIIPNAFLLNCANTAAAVEAATETAEEAIKITAISFNELGEPVLTCPDSYGNGTVVVEGAASLTSPMQWHDKTSGDKFFRTVLKP